MAGQFASLRSDDCFFRTRVRQSVGPLYYHMFDGQRKLCKPCLPLYGKLPSRRDMYDSKDRNIFDIETALLKQNRPIGCGRDRIHMVQRPARRGMLHDVGRVCPNFLNSMDTLLTHPREHYRELGTDHLIFLDRERDQSSWIYWDYPLNTTQLAKDSYIPKIPFPIDPNPSLPPGQRWAKNI